jgi:hypothetical protein
MRGIAPARAEILELELSLLHQRILLAQELHGAVEVRLRALANY